MKRQTRTKTPHAREGLHQLVDRLPVDQMHAAGRFLEFLCAVEPEDEDTEPLSAEAREAIRRGEGEIRRGEYITLEEYERARKL
jgi:hypothetical protein